MHKCLFSGDAPVRLLELLPLPVAKHFNKVLAYSYSEA